jgi:predicted Rossmann fold nucleotide-binding protein DprA/Smf involved in DNA uptake
MELKALLEKSECVCVGTDHYLVGNYFKRNKLIVDECDILLVVLSPSATSGGTYKTVQYAKKQNKNIFYVDSE